MRFRQTILTILLAVLLPLFPVGAGFAEEGRHALLIGVGAHDFWSALSAPPREAETIGSILVESYGYDPKNVTVLTDSLGKPPVGEAITSQLDRLSRSLSRADSLLVFFSGRSAADNTGETWWIPKDGKSESREGWLSLSLLSRRYFASNSVKAGHILVLCDSPAKAALSVQKPNPLSSEDLRYSERVMEWSRRKGRQIIYSGLPYRPGDEATDGMSAFAFRIVRALEENDIAVSDMETLLFSPHLPAAGLAGPPFLRGRFVSSPDDGGLLLLARSIGPKIPHINAATAPVTQPADTASAEPAGVRILSATVTPAKGPRDAVYAFNVQTAEPASRVVLRMGSEKTNLVGSGKSWGLDRRISRAGTLSFSVTAYDVRGNAGPAKDGFVTVGACLVKVVRTSASPGIGYSGSEFSISAQTDRPAGAAFLWLDNEKIPMTGSGTSWRVSRPVSGSSFKTYTVTATDQYGAECQPLPGKIMFIKPPGVPDVASLTIRPKPAAPGEYFTVEVRTSEAAARVNLRIGDRQIPMEGGPLNWKAKASWPEAGNVPVSAVAENSSGAKGAARNDSLSVVRPVPPPEPTVQDGSARPASLEKVTAKPDVVGVEQPVLFTARVSGQVSRVVVSIEGVDHPMRAESTSLWTLTKSFRAFGPKIYTVTAVGRDGQTSKEVVGSILVQAPIVKIVESYLQPPSIRPGIELTIIATTDREAAGMEIKVGDAVRAMEAMDSSRKKWRYSTTLPDPIPEAYKIVLRPRNEEGKMGRATTWTINE